MTAGAPFDLIFASMEDWDEVWRRNQFLVDGLARRHPDARVLFVGLPRDLSHDLRRARVCGGGRQPATRPAPAPENVTVTRPLKLFPNSLAAGRVANRWLFRVHVARAARRARLRNPVLWLNPHSAGHLAGRLGEAAVVYDITDDWTTLSQPSAVARRTAREDAALCRRADAVIVCSPRLFEMKRGLARDLHLIPNGVDLAHYAGASGRREGDESGSHDLPEIARAWPRPVYGYTGTIHPDRVDVSLLEQAARLVPQGSFAMVGPNYLDEADVQRLRRTGNVFLTGPVSYAEVPGFMRAFDVCMTPHRVTPFTESLNPIKLWEYLAAGKPIVSTPVAGFRDYPQFVSLASGPADFAAALQAALHEDSGVCDLRRQEAARHGWDRRLDAVEAVLAECVARNAKGAGADDIPAAESARSAPTG